MKLLGAVLAGGQSRRFGSDKAHALFEGRRLFDHVADSLLRQVDALVVAGRDWPGLLTVADLPVSGLGPLGGLAGALDHAGRQGFDAVLSCGCDVIGVPHDLAKQLGAGSALSPVIEPVIAADMPIIGLWPVDLRAGLLDWLCDPQNRSVYRFADHVGARRAVLANDLRNVNRPEDLL